MASEGFSRVVVPGLMLQSSSSRDHMLSCPRACGIFLKQGLNPCPMHWPADS